MILNLLKHGIRSLKKQKAFVFINMIGLSIGLVCAIIIALFIRHELSFDTYHEKKDRIYQLVLHGRLGGQEVQTYATASVIAPTMQNEFPEVESFLRMYGWGKTVLKYKEKFFTEDHFIEADSTFFSFFSIPLLKGNPETALAEPYYVVLSENTARRIFGDDDPINKMIRLGDDETYYKVTGIMADIPENTHFSASGIASFMTNPRANSNEWFANSFSTYIMLKPGTLPEQVDERFAPMIEKYVGPAIMQYLGISLEEFLETGNKYRMFLQPLTGIHLNTSVDQNFKPANDPKYLWIFGSIAILIIIIAAVNFMNLSTAQAARRAKEIGMKKVCGSTQRMLIWQFLFETFVLAFFAMLVGVLITELILPYFNDLLDIKLSVGYLTHWYTIPALLLLSVIIGVMAGIYPAFYMSSFNPNMVLKGKMRSGKENGKLRRALVVVQFSISIILIVGTIIMYKQLNYMQKKDLGFDSDRIFVISNAITLGKKVHTFKEELLQLQGIEAVSASTAVPGRNNNNNAYAVKGRETESFLLYTNWADKDFLKTYGIPLSTGEFFNENSNNDMEGCVLNQRAVKHYMLENEPLATRFIVDNDSGDAGLMPVIGIVEDFHHESLRHDLAPYMIRFKSENNNWGYISIRMAVDESYGIIEDIADLWGSFTGGSPMQSFFMEDIVTKMYREERQNGQLSLLFALVGIMIATMGLYGLTAYSIAQRTKEIGIRKTYGATVGNIWSLFAREIIILVFIASVIAIPLTWWVAGNWLHNYPYRINIQVLDFLYGLLIAVIIALATISYRTIRSARMNPTRSLRYE